MELVLAIAIGILTGSGVWLLLRPRTFQLVIGFSLLSYAVNLFIFSMGRLRAHAPPVVDGSGCRIPRFIPTRFRRRWCSPRLSSASL